MLYLIIRKEIHDNVLNVRFVGACLVSIILIISSIVVLSESYTSELRDYQSRVIAQDQFIDQYGHSNRISWMSQLMREPSHYRPLVAGIDREAAEQNFVSNPIPVLLPRLDFVAIVTIIVSLMAILFSYNAISGEREDGLLKLMLSTSVSRGTIIVGKFIGGNISLLVPFTIGVLCGLVYMALNPALQLQTMDLNVFLLLLIASFLYISAFYAASLFCSTRSQTSNEAILKSLYAWILFVLLVPNISPSIAAQVYGIPSATQMDQDVFRITSEERDKIINQRQQIMLQKEYPDIVAARGLNQQEMQSKLNSDPAFRERYALYSKAYDEMVVQVNKEQQEQAKQILLDFANRSGHQEKLARVFASFSPFSNYVFIATDLTETGIDADDRWESLASSYEKELQSFTHKKYELEKQKNPAFTSNDYLDLRDRPRFHYQPPGIGERADLVMLPFGLLLGFVVLFVGAAVVSFLKYDVR